MALNDEQRSLLQLLLGGQSYDDIGSLLGTDSDTVRRRAREALTEVGGADPDAKVGLTDYLLGKADPIGRADAVRQLQNDPESSELASDIVSRLRLLAPNAQLPDVPAPKGGARRSAPGPSAPTSPGAARPGSPGERQSPLSGLRERAGKITSGSGGGSEDDERRRKTLIAAGLGALLIAVVLVVVLVSGGGDDSSEGDETTAAQNADPDILSVELSPTGDAPGQGQAVIAITQDQPLIQVNLSELEPAPRGQTYIMWLYSSDRAAFPLGQDRVGEDGVLNGRIPIPSQFLQAVALFGCIDVSLASVSETRQALQEAGQGIPAYTGTSIVRGEIPVPPETTAPSGPESNCETTAAAEGGGAGAQGGGAAQGGAQQP